LDSLSASEALCDFRRTLWLPTSHLASDPTVPLHKICDFDLSRFANITTWVSDGSMLPFSAGVLDLKTVVGAATGAQTLAMKIPDTNISMNLHGELIGLVLALISSRDLGSANESEHLLLTDHLSTVRFVELNQVLIKPCVYSS
jgi:hypothetical protein